MPLVTINDKTRRHLRWRVWGVEGGIAPGQKVLLVDISEGGALIEHAYPVRAGTILLLTLPSGEQQGSLKCRVVRSREHRFEVWPTGEHEHAYRTGLEFLELSENCQRLINQYIVAGIRER